MFRTTRFSIALGLALAVFCTMALPASAQGTVRDRDGPPAPKPTLDRDHRTGPRPTDPVQWEIRGAAVNTCEKYMLANASRAGLGRPSMLTPTDKGIGWSKDGGNWGFDLVRKVDDGSRIMCGNLNPGIKDKLGLFSTKKQAWLDARLKWTGSIPQVWAVKHITSVKREGITYQRFAIFNEVELRYLMLCHDEEDKKKNSEALCLYDAVVYPAR